MVFTVLGPIEADPEYQLIVDSNNMLVEVDNEISACRIAQLCMTNALCVCVCSFRCSAQVCTRQVLETLPRTGVSSAHSSGVHCHSEGKD